MLKQNQGLRCDWSTASREDCEGGEWRSRKELEHLGLLSHATDSIFHFKRDGKRFGEF